MFKVLVTGCDGQVGSEISKSAPESFEVISLNSQKLDITSLEQIHLALEKYKPDLVINAAAYTKVDLAESEPELAYKINDVAVAYLASATNKADIPLFHISTDYVFDGKLQTPYKENFITNPKNIYGKSKLAGEKSLSNINKKNIIIRTSWVFGYEGSNFVKTMLKLGELNKGLSIVSDQHGCPTSASSIAEILWKFAILYRQRNDLQWGVYHFCNFPETTWYDFAFDIFQSAEQIGLLKPIPNLYRIQSQDYLTAAERPRYSNLDCKKIKEALSLQQSYSWHDELKKLLIAFKDV